MRLWTFQGIEIYEQMMRDGITYCLKPTWSDDKTFMYCYRWMAKQMRERIGEPPLPCIEFPMWAWYQYESRKKRKPKMAPTNIPEGHSVFMEIDLPDEQVLLSDFNLWHAPLNFAPLSKWRKIAKKTDLLDKQAGKLVDFFDYPQELQQEIADSWTDIFELTKREKDTTRVAFKNRSIQATFWALRPSDIISVLFFERTGKTIRRLEK